MIRLTPGANAPLPNQQQCLLRLERGSEDGLLGDYAGLALLPVDERRMPQGEVALIHRPDTSWLNWTGQKDVLSCSCALGQLPPVVERVLVILYVFQAVGPLQRLGPVTLRVDEGIEYVHDLGDSGESAMVLAELYRRQGTWKVRALADGSAYGLAALGRRLGVELDERHPQRASGGSGGAAERRSCTGTGFAVTSQHILTCAHVIEGVDSLSIVSFDGRHSAELVVMDSKNDLALLRVPQAEAFKPVRFREGLGSELGENIVTLGFPLAGLAGGGVQVTQGCVSGLFGPFDDAGLMQFTAPIQPGSSGGPVFDPSGLVAGVVTSSMRDTQNMNFAVKSALVLAFLEAAGLQVGRARPEQPMTTPELIRQVQGALWRVEAKVH
ncbi:MAG: trypsin-like peptidase domain-containing protein [Pseudomonas sp.]|uniref:trypsin-like peptidase domain-containing protein n=1 Tax=Pseudomonas sp. TaxID=306 RepID=UPI0033933983